MKLNPFTIIKLVLALFITVGLGLTIFLVIQDVKIIGAYIFSGLFILGPGAILYGFTFGFSISEKNSSKQAERQESISFDNTGITYNLPLFDVTQFIGWKTIETVIFTDYQSDDNSKFIFHLSQPPILTRSENPWFLNKLFPFATANKLKITIEDDCNNFHQLPQMLDTYLATIMATNLNADVKRGTLISSKTTSKNNTITTEESWKPNADYQRERLIFDKYNRTLQQIKYS